MGIFKWLKKATKVIGKMAVEAAEEDEQKEPESKPAQVPNPTNDAYLNRWNDRKPPQIIELEMPELTFQSRYDFSKVRGFDFGMENNQITLFIDGKNRLTAKEDILSLNCFLSEGHMNDPEIPVFLIHEKDIRFEPSQPSFDDYTRLFTLPLTPTGKKPKYPLELSFCTLSQDEHWKASTEGGKEIFGQIWYLSNGEIGKARVICWEYQKKHYRCFVFQIRRNKDGLYLMKIEQPTQY